MPRSKKLSLEKIKDIYLSVTSIKKNKSKIARENGISRYTLYQYLKFMNKDWKIK
jgi:DNA-binding phage protein